MLKVENRSKEEIAKTGRKIGEAFAAEKAGIVTLLTEEQTVKAFEIMTGYFYRASLTVMQSGGEQYAKIFKKEQNYIAVSMVVVLREFQGKGFMHRVLEQPFAEAAWKLFDDSEKAHPTDRRK